MRQETWGKVDFGDDNLIILQALEFKGTTSVHHPVKSHALTL